MPALGPAPLRALEIRDCPHLGRAASQLLRRGRATATWGTRRMPTLGAPARAVR